MTGLVLLLWTIDVVRQVPEIPPQTPEVSYFEIISHKKRHNHVDDFCVTCAAFPIVVN